MKPNFIDKSVLWARSRLVHLFDKLVRIADVEEFPWIVLPVAGIGIVYCFGYPLMFWIHCRKLYPFLEDDDHRRTYPCRLIHGERGVNWKKEGF